MGTRGARPREGARPTITASVVTCGRAEDLYEALARDRRRYERLVYGRLRGGICWQDAEDIVSDALIRALVNAEDDPPQEGKEQAWFSRIVFNRGIDFLRARDGRRREGARSRPDLVSISELAEAGVELAEDVECAGTAEAWIDALDQDAEQAQAEQAVERALASMPSDDADLVRLRHLLRADASRDEVAAAAGLTLGEFRWRYARAWKRFVEAISRDTPTERCFEIRGLIGELHTTVVPMDVASEIDAHVLDCPSCRVFARDSYRALELMPFVPTAGFVERWTARVASLWVRSGPDAAAGGGAAAAAGTGASGMAGAGGTASALKALVVLCGTTAVTAGVCSGVFQPIDGAQRPRHRRVAEAAATPAPSASTSTASARTPASTARTTSSSRKPKSAPKAGAPIPASASPGSQEFVPSGSAARPDPAPAPTSGGGEFGP